jgi:bacteriorhodopsin
VTVNLTPTQVVAVIVLLVVVVMMWRSGTRRAHRAAQAAHAASRVVSLAGQVLSTAGVIVGAQWLVITYALGSTLFWVALALPALIAGHVLTKALTVTSVEVTHRRGDSR